MDEWMVVTVIVALVGLFMTIGAPIIKLNTNITTLNENLKSMREELERHESSNKSAHARIWAHNEEQDKLLDEHTIRLHDLDGK